MASSGLEAIAIFNDVHVPFEDPRAWELFLKAGHLIKPKHLWCLGDFLDCWSVSAHDKDPSRRLILRDEVEIANERLDEADEIGAKEKIFCAGNHSDRLRRYLGTRAPELEGLVSVQQMLRLKQRGWTYVPYKQFTRVGKLYLTHDVGATGRQAIYRNLDTFQHSNVCGHSHRLAYVVEGNAVGEQKLAASFGWLGDRKQVDYMASAKAAKDWALGFGTGYLDPSTGLCYLTPIPIIVTGRRYSCCVNGTLLTV